MSDFLTIGVMYAAFN